ncbi:MFS transporter [Dysgonomonas macrotermitis]|uniref:Glycoside/pentoside/hexuronide:cation symporter, GPH family n=1 Tax=Dysgonomonas macrotermitis TaxID=1346286 RepID=A0A1M4T507_9BACT|nr:MFS transporter [Dysgonomonas macrotermitis]SHE39510.1 glycoside/pentoside/hexuronide:cation symporter, GPH family [Dysgonomonas macrotermitis]
MTGTNKVSLKEKIGYGFGDMASSMFWKIFGMYSLFFYTDVFGITAAAAGTMFLIARLWDSFFDLFVGIMADRTKTRWGSYRPYLLWFAIPFAVMGVFTFFVPDFAETGKLIYAYVTYSLMMIVYSIINVPYASLLGVMSSNPQERNILSSYRMSFAFIGSFITFMLLQPLIDGYAKAFGSGEVQNTLEQVQESSVSTSPIGWTLGVATIGIICTVLFFLCFSWTRERVKPVNEDENTSVKQDLKNLFQNSPWWILVATGLAALLFNAVRDGVAIYYFRDYVQFHYRMPLTGWDMTTIYFLVGQAANLVGVIMAPTLSSKYGKKRTYMISIAIAGALSIVFFFIPNQIGWILLLQALISVCAGYVLPLLWSMFADIVDYQELKTNRRASGLIFSSSSMSQKLGWALGAALTGWVLSIFKYNPEIAQQSMETIFGEKLMISIFPAVCCLLAFIGMMVYPLSEKKVKEITQELEEKRGKLN